VRSPGRRWSTLCLSLPVFAVLLCLPAGAAALNARLSLGATHGYRLTLTEFGYGATLKATRVKGSKPTHGSWTDYVVRAKPSADRVDAGFGALGQISMRFRPSGLVTYGKPQRGCRGPDRYSYRHGVFVGSLDFEGEEGFTTVHAHRVKGTVAVPGRLRCEASGGEATGKAEARHGSKPTSFEAGWRSGLTARYLSASGGGERATFAVSSYETQGRLAIYRRAFASGAASAFRTDSALSFATLSPPAPFSGTGLLRRNASGARNWTGSLAVSFPGDPGVPLTGSQFKTLLTRGW
jgi:hypothetical protein